MRERKRGGAWRAFAAGCAGLVLGGAAARAEGESVDVGDAAPSAAAPYHLGKGPGRNNSYVARYEEDFSYLRDPATRANILDPLKYIPLNALGDVYLTLNGEARLRIDYTQHKNFGVAASAVPSATGGAPRFTAATRGNENELYKQRYALGGDLHLGENLRVYADLYHAQQTGREVGPSVPANQRDALSLVDAFVEPSGRVGDARLGTRVGRQVLFFGAARNIGANLATSLPDPTFDGIRGYADWGNARVDVFAFNRVKYVDGVIEDVDSPHTNLWGLYSSLDVPRFALAGANAATSADVFYFGFRSNPNANAAGSGFYDDRALQTGATVSGTTGSGFVPSQDHRHTLGLRYYGTVGALDFDWEAMLQRGSFAGFSVQAWAANTDTGYTFAGLPWKPRIGTHLDVASGGADRAKREIYTYQPLIPDTYYYLPNSFISPSNFYDVAPRLTLTPAPTVRVEIYDAFLWRYSVDDAVYSGNWKGAGSANPYAPTALVAGRSIGQQPDIAVFWTPVDYLRLRLEYAMFFPGSALRNAQAKTTSYVNTTIQFRF